MLVRLKDDGRRSNGSVFTLLPGVDPVFYKGKIVHVTKEYWDLIVKAKVDNLFEIVKEEELKKETEANIKATDKEWADTKRKRLEAEIKDNGKIAVEKAHGIKVKEPAEETTEEPEKEIPKEPEKVNVGEDKALTEDEAYDLNKEEQTILLKKRGFKSSDIGTKEPDRVKQIIESNPK